jgi:hypothetical protein
MICIKVASGMPPPPIGKRVKGKPIVLVDTSFNLPDTLFKMLAHISYVYFTGKYILLQKLGFP